MGTGHCWKPRGLLPTYSASPPKVPPGALDSEPSSSPVFLSQGQFHHCSPSLRQGSKHWPHPLPPPHSPQPVGPHVLPAVPRGLCPTHPVSAQASIASIWTMASVSSWPPFKSPHLPEIPPCSCSNAPHDSLLPWGENPCVTLAFKGRGGLTWHIPPTSPWGSGHTQHTPPCTPLRVPPARKEYAPCLPAVSLC